MTRPRARLEKFEQADGVKLLRSLGASVYVSGTTRRRGDFQGTMQTPGIPDVEAFMRRPPRLLKWECKSATGRLSDAQKAYREDCLECGIDYVSGDVHDLIKWLVWFGYLKADQLTAERQARL